MNRKQKKSLKTIIATAVILAAAILVSGFTQSRLIKIIIFAVPYLTIGNKVLKKSFAMLRKGQMLDENFLMSIASIGAFILGEYVEAVAVLLFYSVGELFESVAVGKSRKSISDLMDICPEYANIEKDGTLQKTDPMLLEIDDIIVVKPGERVPIDGVVIDGSSTLDTSALTGESAPRKIAAEEEIFSGCINISGVLRVRVRKTYNNSTVAKILELVENSALAKSRSESFITKFARVYTPIVVACAAVVALIPSLITGDAATWIGRALIFLVVSCPCALVISVPLSFFAGIGAASKAGILVKGSSYIERLAKTETVIFDKTGTLTQGNFEVTEIHPEHMSDSDLLELAATAEYYSDHPIAASVKKAYGKQPDTSSLTDVNEIPGNGISAMLGGELLLAGNIKLMEKRGIKCEPRNADGTVIHIARGIKYEGYIVISDKINPDSQQAIAELKRCGAANTVMLTGDRYEVAKQVCGVLCIDEFHSELFPGDKVKYLEEYISKAKNTVVFVGDGINDAPVLARADIGIAMGAIGSDSAIEAADIVLMDDKISKIPTAIRIAAKTMGIVKQNIVFAIGIKVLVMMLSIAGFANMWLAVFADVGVSVIAILNAMRAMR